MHRARPSSPRRRCRARQASWPARGFTLIELIVVLAILGSLLALAVPRYFGAVDQGKLSVQQANQHSLRDAIDKYYADRGRYPDRLDELVSRRYLREVPVDPVSAGTAWRLVAPPDGLQGRIYDVLPPDPPAGERTSTEPTGGPETDGPAPPADALPDAPR